MLLLLGELDTRMVLTVYSNNVIIIYYADSKKSTYANG